MKIFTRKISRIGKLHKLYMRLMSLLIAISFIFTSVYTNGLHALAAQDNADTTTNTNITDDESSPNMAEDFFVSVVRELTEYRNEFSKTFLMSDGTLESVVSSNPIHYSKDGKWQEIDSTLTLSTDEKGNQVYKNTSGAYSVELPASAQSGEEITITKGEKELSIKLIEAKNSKAKKDNSKKEKKQKLTKEQRKRMTAGQLFEVDNTQTDAIEYSEVYSNADLRYDVTPNEVKESVILNKAPNKKASYSYEITVNGLTAVLNSDGSVDFYSDAQNKEVAFHIPPPLMYDANDEYSYDIKTTLTEKKGIYTLTYKPDYDWLKSKDRAYPVVLDPSVVVNSSIQDSYTYSADSYLDTYLGYEQQLKVGTTPNDYWQTYLKFNELPEIPYESYRIDGAYLMLTPKSAVGSWTEMELGVYELTENWYNHQTGTVEQMLTHNNAPASLSYTTATASVARGAMDMGVGFEIAHLVEDWYAHPDTNFGIKIAAHLEESQYNDHIVFHSSRSTTGQIPYLTLTYSEYIPVMGIEITGKPTDNKIELGYYAPPYPIGVTVYPENATNKEIIWESSNPNVAIAYVDYDNHYIEYFSLGTTVLTAKSADNSQIIDSFELTVYNIPVEGIDLVSLPENCELNLGETDYLSFIFNPYDATDGDWVQADDLTWSSDAPSVVHVDGEGKLTAISYGTATITATYGDAVGTCTITVPRVAVTDVYFVMYPSQLAVGSTFNADTLVFPENATDKRLNIVSQNPSVADVIYNTDPNKYISAPTIRVVALSEGTATIVATSLDDPTKTTSFTVTVISSSIELNKPQGDSLLVDDYWQLCQNPNITITSSNSNVIAPLENGYITAVGVGTATLTLSLPSESNSVQYTITVGNPLSVTGIPTNNTIKIGDAYENLWINNSSYYQGDVVWESSDPDIAEIYYDYVRARVVLIGKAEGTAFITVKISGTNIWSSFDLIVEPLPIDNLFIDPYNYVDNSYENTGLEDGVLYVGEHSYLILDVYYSDPTYGLDDLNGVDWLLEFETSQDFLNIEQITPYLVRVTAEREGHAEIYAQVDNVISGNSIPITVKGAASYIKVPNNHIVRTGTQYDFDETVYPEYAPRFWSVDNANLATINGQGVLQTLNNGTVNVTLTYSVARQTYTHTITICISNVVITNVPGNRTLFVNGTRDLNATVFLDNNTTSTNVTWRTSDENIVSIDEDEGIITGVNEGIATVWAIYEDNTEMYGFVTITVEETTSYVYYLNTAVDNYTLEAQLYSEIIGEEVYGGVNERVVLRELVSTEQFIEDWNNMDDGTNIGYVVIFCHANPDGFVCLPNDNSISTFTVEQLQNKDMHGFISSGCNAGHLDHKDTNIANAFAKKINGAPVIASDGTTYYTILDEESETIENATDDYGKWWSRADQTFLNWCTSERNDNSAWVIYVHTHNETKVFDIEETQVFDIEETQATMQGVVCGLHLSEMLDALSYY